MRFKIALILCFLFSFQLDANVIPQIHIDSVRNADLPIKLKGEWQFEYNSDWLPDENDQCYLVELPNFWTSHHTDDGLTFDAFGYGRYSLELYIEEPREGLGLYIEHIHSAYRVLLNGNIAYESGQIGTSENEYKAVRKPHVVPLPNINKIHLVIEASNFDHYRGGILRSPLIVDLDMFQTNELLEHFIDMFIAGGTGIMGITMLIVVIFVARSKELLYFSLLSIVLSFRLVFSGGYPLHFILPIQDHFELSIRAEYMALFMLSIFGSRYIVHLFSVEKFRPLYMFYTLIGILLTVCTIFLPVRVFTCLTPYYLVILLLMVLTISCTVVKGVRNGDRSAHILGAGILIVVIWAITDSLTYFHIFNPSRLFYSLAFFLFVLSNNLALIDRFIFRLIKSRKQITEQKINDMQRLLMSMVSHEIKTPMAQLQMNLDMLEVVTEDIDAFALHSDKIIGRFKKSIGSVKKMMNDFVYFMNASIRDLERIPKQELLQSLHGIDLRVDQTFTQEFSFDSNLKVLIYAVRSFVSNAIKYTPTEKPQPHIQLIHLDGKYQLQIIDHGIGIQPDLIAMLGKSISITKENLDEINGVGFYLASEMLRNLNHDVSVDSELNKGTVVTISLN